MGMCGRVVLPFPCWELLCERCDVLPPLVTFTSILRGMINGNIKLRPSTHNELTSTLNSSSKATKKSPPISPYLREWVVTHFEVHWSFLEEYSITDYFRRSISMAMKKKLGTILRLLSLGVVKLRPPASLFLHSTLELRIQVRLFSSLIPASHMERFQIFSWPHLRRQVCEAMEQLSSTKCVGYHGNLDLGGKIWMDVQRVRKTFPGRPHFPDLQIGQKIVAFLDKYFGETNPPPGPFLINTDCPDSIPEIIPFNDLVQPLDNLQDKKGWMTVYPELRGNPELLNKLTSKKENTPLDFLYEAGLLDPCEGSCYMISKSTTNDMFFLDKVGSMQEMDELSVLQALLMAYNLLTPKRNERGWWMVAVGLTKGNGHPLHERAQTTSYSSEMELILDALLFGYKVLEVRFSKWVDRVSGRPNYFQSQRDMVSKWDEGFKGQERKVKVQQNLVVECWLSVARGTTVHLDKSNYGHSIAFYSGPGWSSDSPLVGFGIPELRFLWKHSSGSVMAIKGWQWFHMSLKFPEDVIKMMNACFVNEF
jgi:hypothetical protein